MSNAEGIHWYYCACESYEDDPGMVVCWKCEQPVVSMVQPKPLDMIGAMNLMALCIRYRDALEKITSDAKRPELADAEYLAGIAEGVLHYAAQA